MCSDLMAHSRTGAPSQVLQRFPADSLIARSVRRRFGLFHPFQGGCSSPNDYVSDTKEQAQPEYECVSTPQDTCPQLPGTDVFQNIMDYPPDACMTTLLTGQSTRIAVSWNTYRCGCGWASCLSLLYLYHSYDHPL